MNFWCPGREDSGFIVGQSDPRRARFAGRGLEAAFLRLTESVVADFP